MSKRLTIALAGNPNSGKTTVFNSLTGSRQHVGNYPGVTVEKKEGNLNYKGYEITVVDLPGTYSLTAYSIDEIVTRNFVVEEKPDVVIDVIDASNLERNLYLATQFMELRAPLILAFNMFDLAEKQGLAVDKKRLSELLGCPIVFTVATKKTGITELLEEAIKLKEGPVVFKKAILDYGREMEEEIKKIEDILTEDRVLIQKYASRWLTVKLLESDSEVIKKAKASLHAGRVLEQTERSINHLKNIFGDNPEAIIAERRYGLISGACSEAAQRTYELRHTTSDKIDKVLVNRALGLPIFLGLAWLLFRFVFGLSQPLMRWIEIGQAWLQLLVGSFLPEGSVIQSLVVNGVIGGVGSVLVFVPIIFLLFLVMAILEDSGYMARVAFIMDRFMHKLGLHGRSSIPMLLGFGCTLPAIMATRSIDDRKDRLVTILVNPFMSCGARLPFYALFIAAFFPGRMAGNILFSLYLLGIIVAVIMAKLFRRYLFRGPANPFVMELPPYRMPTLKGLLIHMWERGVVYLKKAGTVIFIGCVLVWFLSNFPWNPQHPTQDSYAGRLGRVIAPVFKPLGFDDWRLSVGLIGGFIGKEIVVGTLGTLYSVDQAGNGATTLREALQNQTRADGEKMYTPLVAYAAMVFVLLYIPCIAVIGVIKKETNSWRWPLFTVFYTTAVAWIVALIVYQGGRLLGLG